MNQNNFNFQEYLSPEEKARKADLARKLFEQTDAQSLSKSSEIVLKLQRKLKDVKRPLAEENSSNPDETNFQIEEVEISDN